MEGKYRPYTEVPRPCLNVPVVKWWLWLYQAGVAGCWFTLCTLTVPLRLSTGVPYG